MSKLKVFNAVLMVAGTSVGTGILGLPIATSKAGFVPSLLAFFVSWLFMTLAAYYILEVKMQVRGNNNLSSMINLTLGKCAHVFSAAVVLGLLYALLCTYMMAGSSWLSVLVSNYLQLSDVKVILVFSILFALILYCGERFIYNINNFLAICLILAFFITIGLSLVPQNYAFLEHADYSSLLPSLPMLLTTFGFSIIVPAVVEYLEYDKNSVATAIFWGGVMALAAYVLWEWVTLSNIPLSGIGGLRYLADVGDNGTGVILSFAKVTNNPIISIAGRIFAIFAAITSFMGVSLALMHSLSDSLKLKESGFDRIILLLLMYVPPILITFFVPNVFVEVLGFAGLFVAILLGLFPVAMVYRIRNRDIKFSFWNNLQKNFYLIISAIFFIFVIFQEIKNLYG